MPTKWLELPAGQRDSLLAQLKYFYWVPAIGGHANDGDQFIARIGYSTSDDLADKLKALKSSKIDVEPLSPSGWQKLGAIDCHVAIRDTHFEMAILGTGGQDPYSSTTLDYASCLQIEQAIDEAGLASAVDYSAELELRERVLPKLKG